MHRPTAPFPILAWPLLLATAWLPAQAPAPASPPATAELPADRRAGAAAVDVARCKDWLGTLAGPAFAGRGTGQPGYELAANYVAEQFRALGLEARGEQGTYFQHVPWVAAQIDAEQTSIVFTRDGTPVLRIPAARLAGSATAALDATGDVVLLAVPAPAPAPEPAAGERGGRGSLPAIAGLDQLEAAAVAGKVVVACLPAGEAARPRLPAMRFAVMQALQGKQAAALVFVQPAEVSGGITGRGGGGRGAGNPALAGGRRAPATLTFGGKDWTDLLAASGTTTEQLAAAERATVLPLPLQAAVTVALVERQAPAMNVFAVLPGADPGRRDEYVVIGSHLDHLGRRGDTIYPGADDDASGTTGVLAIARMFAKNPVRPARSVLFVCFAGEESGLVGSRFFADNCPVPLPSIVAELQLDMIGRDEEENAEGDRGEKAEDNRNSLHLVGTEKLAPALHALCMQRNELAGFDLEFDQEGMFGRSDHANFARHGVPIAFFFTGLHRDYHQPTDTPEKIHYEKLLRIATYVYDIAFELATQADRPEVDPKLWARYRGRAADTPAAPLRAADK